MLNVLRNITLDFNGHTLYGTADLPQDENSELESFLEFKVHPNDYIKDMQTVRPSRIRQAAAELTLTSASGRTASLPQSMWIMSIHIG